MSTLHDRLSDLADEAPTGPPPRDLWESGRRLHRRRRLGTAVVVATSVALIGGLAGLSWSRSDVDVQPAGPHTELGIPDRFYLPSERLPGTDDTGPIGPLSVVLSGYERLVGVSGTGEYAYLDLPAWPKFGGLDVPGDIALSPDGTKLAYWSSGRSSGAPIDKEADPVVAVRVYDTVSGDVATYAVPTEHGLSPQDLTWTEDTLWFEIWQYDTPEYDGSRGSRLEQTVAWNPRTDEHASWDGRPPDFPFVSATSWRDALVTLGRQGILRLTTLDGTEVRARITTPTDLESGGWLDRSGTRLAAISDNVPNESGSPEEKRPLWVADLPDPAESSSRVSMRQVPGTDALPTEQLIGWRDETHIVVARYGEGATGIVSVDTESGAMEVLVPLAQWNIPEFAADALAGPVFDAPEPPDPMNPLVVYGGSVLVLLAGSGVLLWWRRRVQR
jgi:hypothetical protein